MRKKYRCVWNFRLLNQLSPMRTAAWERRVLFSKTCHFSELVRFDWPPLSLRKKKPPNALVVFQLLNYYFGYFSLDPSGCSPYIYLFIVLFENSRKRTIPDRFLVLPIISKHFRARSSIIARYHSVIVDGFDFNRRSCPSIDRVRLTVRLFCPLT